MSDDTEPLGADAASTAPLCVCGSPMYRDRTGVAVDPRVPGWMCMSCVGVIDVTKLNPPR